MRLAVYGYHPCAISFFSLHETRDIELANSAHDGQSIRGCSVFVAGVVWSEQSNLTASAMSECLASITHSHSHPFPFLCFIYLSPPPVFSSPVRSLLPRHPPRPPLSFTVQHSASGVVYTPQRALSPATLVRILSHHYKDHAFITPHRLITICALKSISYWTISGKQRVHQCGTTFGST